jgi:hypothetical protein
MQTIVVAVSEKKQRRLLQSERKGSAVGMMASPRACQRTKQLQRSHLPNRINMAVAGTMLSEAAASTRFRLRPILHPLQPTQEDALSGRQPQRAVNVCPLVLKCRLWNPSEPIQKRLTLQTISHRVSLHSRGSTIYLRTSPLRPALC